MSYGGGGGGSGNISTDGDVALNNPADGQVLVYNGTVAKWENQTNTTAQVGEVALDSFSGGSDDAMLTAAMSYASAQDHPPVIRLTNRTYSFSTARTLYTGFRMAGPGGIADSELADVNMQCKVTVGTSGTWLNITGGDVYDCYIGGMSFVGTSTTTFMGCDGSAWHLCQFRDVSFHQFLTVLGTQSQKLLMTASLIDGWFQIQGTYNGGVHIGGSDNRLFTNGALIDSSTAYTSGAPGQYHFWFDGLDNTYCGPVYITAEAGFGAIHVSGSAYNASGPPSNLGMVWMHGATIEGRNASAPCWGNLIRVDGGILKLRDAYVARAMSNPTAMGHSPTDAGAIHITGGMALIDGITYDRYTAQPESVPFVYVNGGNARVMNTLIASKGGVWTGQPQVHNAGAGTLVTDDSVTVV